MNLIRGKQVKGILWNSILRSCGTNCPYIPYLVKHRQKEMKCLTWRFSIEYFWYQNQRNLQNIYLNEVCFGKKKYRDKEITHKAFNTSFTKILKVSDKVTQSANQHMHTFNFLFVKNLKFLKTLLHVSVIRPSSGNL